MNKIIGALDKSDNAEVRVSTSTWKGRSVIDIRLWYRPGGAVEYVPSRKGLTMDIHRLPELIALLERV